jgi:hypothetical protein
MARTSDPAKSGTDDDGRITIEIITIETESVAIIVIIRLKTGIPGVVVWRKIGLYHRAGVCTIGGVVPHIIILSLLVQGPVAAG